MKMILRWFPDGDDSVTLQQIKQTPGVSGVAACMPHTPVGQLWTLDAVKALREEINAAGLEMEVIESVNIHEDIKKGLPTRDKYIQNYIDTIKNLHQVGVKCICYNFMPVLDWARSDVEFPLPDGSTAMAYCHEDVLKMNPLSLADAMVGKSRGYTLPGWEPDRLKAMASDIEFYQDMTEEKYWKNMKYFLDAIMPYAEQYDMDFGIHPDDPSWPIYGLPKVITNKDNIRKFFELNGSKRNGLTLCTGSLGSNTANNIPEMVKEFVSMGRVPFVHLRNIKHMNDKDFTESAHLSSCGDLNMFDIVKALYDAGFDGYIRPDHGRMIWGEKARPGYGLYDRALGANYLLGLWEAIDRMSK